MQSQKEAIWVAEYSSGDRTSTAVAGHSRAPGMTYGGFLGHLASGMHVCRGECVAIYATNVDVPYRYRQPVRETVAE